MTESSVLHEIGSAAMSTQRIPFLPSQQNFSFKNSCTHLIAEDPFVSHKTELGFFLAAEVMHNPRWLPKLGNRKLSHHSTWRKKNISRKEKPLLSHSGRNKIKGLQRKPHQKTSKRFQVLHCALKGHRVDCAVQTGRS